MKEIHILTRLASWRLALCAASSSSSRLRLPPWDPFIQRVGKTRIETKRKMDTTAMVESAGEGAGGTERWCDGGSSNGNDDGNGDGIGDGEGEGDGNGDDSGDGHEEAKLAARRSKEDTRNKVHGTE